MLQKGRIFLSKGIKKALTVPSGLGNQSIY